MTAAASDDDDDDHNFCLAALPVAARRSTNQATQAQAT